MKVGWCVRLDFMSVQGVEEEFAGQLLCIVDIRLGRFFLRYLGGAVFALFPKDIPL